MTARRTLTPAPERPDGDRVIINEPERAAAYAELQSAQDRLDRVRRYLAGLPPAPAPPNPDPPPDSDGSGQPLPNIHTVRKWPWQREWWR